YSLYNVGESTVADLFVSFNEDVDIGYYFTSGGWCEIHLSKYIEGKNNNSIGNDNNTIVNNDTAEKEHVKKLTAAAEKVEKILKDADIFFTEDKDISQLVLDTLKEKGLTLSFAESITGGNLSGEFVKNSGASKVFLGGVVSYSNETKKNILGVSQKTLDKYGAVSDEVVREMAFGLKKLMDADISVSVSGIAGPEGGTKDKPVGLIYFGFLFENDFYSTKEIFTGVRTRVMTRAVNMVFVEVLKRLKYEC
ncbi:MAG: CinA family protein, partial [Proteobacteria bacterium]|nr:CinA family protein [Pseudomonadota bacterium]